MRNASANVTGAFCGKLSASFGGKLSSVFEFRPSFTSLGKRKVFFGHLLCNSICFSFATTCDFFSAVATCDLFSVVAIFFFFLVISSCQLRLFVVWLLLAPKVLPPNDVVFSVLV